MISGSAYISSRHLCGTPGCNTEPLLELSRTSALVISLICVPPCALCCVKDKLFYMVVCDDWLWSVCLASHLAHGVIFSHHGLMRLIFMSCEGCFLDRYDINMDNWQAGSTHSKKKKLKSQISTFGHSGKG